MASMASSLATFVLVALSIVSVLSAQTLAAVQGRGYGYGTRAPFSGMGAYPRDLTDDGSTHDGQTYDYIIVGGGLAGLTVANRISESPDVSVLVIEAGGDIYGQDQAKFLTPAANLYNTAVGTQYDWGWNTTAQRGLNGRSASWPRGKVLGGSSSINGLYMVRASEIEHNAWGDLNDARDTWGWDSMLAAMKKSEHFHEPTDAVRETVPSLQYSTSSHGTDGPIHVGWPAVSYPAVEAFLQASENTGTPISNDPDSGKSWGSFLATSCIDPSNWQRSSSRTGYLNDVDRSRANLHVLTGNQVTQVLTNNTDGMVVATGVEYATRSGAQRRTVNAAREVILSGGAINSPQLLQLSGIGDAQQLGNVGIDSVIDLPGVGHNVQDHLASSVAFSQAGNAQMPSASVTGNARTDSFVNSAISYVNVSTLFGDYANTLLDELRANLTQVVNTAPVRDEVKQAYNLTYSAQVNDVFASPIGPIEILFALTFGQVQVQVALQHPLSRGSILITDKDPFTSPAIDAGYLSQNIDLMMLREGVKLARKIGTNSAMSSAAGDEIDPGTGTQSDDQWDEHIRNKAGTEYHPSSGCSMLPRQSGGVVDPNLLVYGTSNLRVIDSSVPPLAVSAHLMTITYGLAEIGADIVNKARTNAAANNGTDNGSGGGASNNGSGSSSDTDTGTNTGTNNTSGRNGAIASIASAKASTAFACLVVAFIGIVFM